jgi:membrane-anchored glycerophosphoryl diester phosphodiesterase (GDPDase)
MKGGRATTVAIVALVEIALVAAIVLAILGHRLMTVSDWMEQVPGGRLVVAVGALVLLVVAAILMTALVSD